MNLQQRIQPNMINMSKSPFNKAALANIHTINQFLSEDIYHQPSSTITNTHLHSPNHQFSINKFE